MFFYLYTQILNFYNFVKQNCRIINFKASSHYFKNAPVILFSENIFTLQTINEFTFFLENATNCHNM